MCLAMSTSGVAFAGESEGIELVYNLATEDFAVFEEIIAGFTAETGINVTIYNGGNDYESAMKTRMSSGDLPDMWVTHGWSLIRYSEYMMNLNDQAWIAGIVYNKNVLEAAVVDGATPWQKFRYIVLPLLIPAIESSVTYNLIGGLKLYDVIIALTDGGPAKKTHSLATYIANRYFDAERAGYAAAVGVFSFVMIMVISVIVNTYFRKKEVDL